MLLDEFGRPLHKAPGVAPGLDKLLLPERNVFEGVANMTLYDDAIEVKATCAHCMGPMEGVLRFDPNYLRARDREDRIADMKVQVCETLQREHYCIPRLEGPKRPAADWLRQFEDRVEIRTR